MKKIFTLFLIILLLVWLNSCGNKEIKQEQVENKKVEKVVSNNWEKQEKKEEKKQEKKLLTIDMNNEEKVVFDMYSSFKISEMKKRIENMKDTPEKVYALSKIWDYKNAFKLNNKLLKDIDTDYTTTLKIILKDNQGNIIKNAKVKNLLSGEENSTNEKWELEFKDTFVIPNKIPLYIEKEWYSSFAYNINLDKDLDKWKAKIETEINLKKAEQKEINYLGKEKEVYFENNASIILPKNWVIVEWTQQKYKWKIKIEFTQFNKEEVLKNKTFRESLEYAVLNWEETVALETFGMIDINLYWENWEKLNINKEAIIKIPVSDINWAKKFFNIEKTWKTKNWFWYLDKELASWVNLEDGILDLKNKVYITKVNHFSNYNFDWAHSYSWSQPRYSTTSRIWRNGKNKVVAYITLTFDWSKKTYTHDFYDNWTRRAPKECTTRCNTTPPTAKVTWFADDIKKPNVKWDIN